MTSGLISLAALAPIWWLAPRREEPPPATATNRAVTGGGDRRLRRFILAYGLFGFGYVITATFISDMVRANPVLQPAEHLVWLWVV